MGIIRTRFDRRPLKKTRQSLDIISTVVAITNRLSSKMISVWLPTLIMGKPSSCRPNSACEIGQSKRSCPPAIKSPIKECEINPKKYGMAFLR